ncbi:hypothetical protein AX774_g8074 [Zancudomyces culisetae]|uniref:DUF1343 domain-containing protein n=1 Tax=Zancudomyces culisetae TaxID=1213189 RepID=A0A1R1PC50_ZANCU|nr:hypothetical protein AX774_g8074 [Zancudomyces culisetae]|eukprot:OMH78530.1 hypothetical protein AX774_g8074 [Zancudomyces culisetae]
MKFTTIVSLLASVTAAAKCKPRYPVDNTHCPDTGSPVGNVKTGFENWLEMMKSPDFDFKSSYGFITNPTAVNRNLVHEVDYLVAQNKMKIVGVVGPEHGFRGAAQAGESLGAATYRDVITNLTVYDGYAFTNGSQWANAFNQMEADTLVFDIQDVGARFYTYIWTMYDAMVGAALAKKKFIVLDRPNPVGGLVVDGATLQLQNASFVGRREIAQQHGMTVGELATLFNEEFLPNEVQLNNTAVKKIDLQVIKMTGWERSMYFDQTGLPWIMPSPNMPTPSTAMVYPGQSLFEGTNLSEGRGTTRPFETVGAPFMKDLALDTLVKTLNSYKLPGVIFRPFYFTPSFSKFSGVECGGLQVYVSDRRTYRPITSAIAALSTIRNQFPANFTILATNFIDKLSGNTKLRNFLNEGASYPTIVSSYQADVAAFTQLRSKYLMY